MKVLSTNELRDMYQRFFENKGHVRILSAPLVPENDPSVLFTTAGMHPLVPYLKGQAHPAGKRLVDAQKCLRTTDMDAVGDATHATVFEMLGNWSLGDYFKKGAIAYSWEFLVSPDWLGLDPKYLAVSIFAGAASTPRDEESAHAWKSLGVPEKRIAYLSVEDNWWPAYAEASEGKPASAPIGLQGPDTEIFYWTGEVEPPDNFDPTDKRWVEIWNNVFMQFNRDEKGILSELPQKNVDTGMGLERTVMIFNGFSSIYEIDTFKPLMNFIREQANKRDERQEKILADHIKAATFILGDDHPIAPSNSDQGYVARRLIRRALMCVRELQTNQPAAEFLAVGARTIIREYGRIYPSLASNEVTIISELAKEAEKFESGLKKIDQILQNRVDINGEQAFDLYATYGFPLEIQLAVADKLGIPIDTTGFAEAMKKHQAKSRAAAAGKFKGGLADTSDMSVKYHTATHLLHQALRDVLGPHAVQRGSNITPERLRFDFSYPDKLTPEQIAAVADMVNEKIRANLPVRQEEMTVDEARGRGALGLFADRYGERVRVYMIGDYSVEICGGPHVEHTGILGTFSIAKEESAGAGVRRIRAVLY